MPQPTNPQSVASGPYMPGPFGGADQNNINLLYGPSPSTPGQAGGNPTNTPSTGPTLSSSAAVNVADTDPSMTTGGQFIQGQQAGSQAAQQQALQAAQQLYQGKGPSLATKLLQQQAQRSMANQNAMASSASGSGSALARRQAMMANAGTMQELGSQAGVARAQEQLGALNEMGTLAGQSRAQDLAMAGGQEGVIQNQAGLNLENYGIGKGAQMQGNQLSMQGAQMGMAAGGAMLMAAGDLHLQEPGGGGQGQPQGGGSSHWIIREEPTFLLAANARTGELRKILTAPLSPDEHQQAMKSHGAGPLGSPNPANKYVNDLDMGGGGQAQAPQESPGAYPPGGWFQGPGGQGGQPGDDGSDQYAALHEAIGRSIYGDVTKGVGDQAAPVGGYQAPTQADPNVQRQMANSPDANNVLNYGPPQGPGGGGAGASPTAYVPPPKNTTSTAQPGDQKANFGQILGAGLYAAGGGKGRDIKAFLSKDKKAVMAAGQGQNVDNTAGDLELGGNRQPDPVQRYQQLYSAAKPQQAQQGKGFAQGMAAASMEGQNTAGDLVLGGGQADTQTGADKLIASMSAQSVTGGAKSAGGDTFDQSELLAPRKGELQGSRVIDMGESGRNLEALPRYYKDPITKQVGPHVDPQQLNNVATGTGYTVTGEKRDTRPSRGMVGGDLHLGGDTGQAVTGGAKSAGEDVNATLDVLPSKRGQLAGTAEFGDSGSKNGPKVSALTRYKNGKVTATVPPIYSSEKDDDGVTRDYFRPTPYQHSGHMWANDLHLGGKFGKFGVRSPKMNNLAANMPKTGGGAKGLTAFYGGGAKLDKAPKTNLMTQKFGKKVA